VEQVQDDPGDQQQHDRASNPANDAGKQDHVG
jgi:hypothetical protein